MIHSRSGLIGFSVAIVAFVLDQVSKWFVMDVLRIQLQAVEILPVFKLVMVWNRGVSFGMLAETGPGRAYFLIAMTLVIVLALQYWLWRETNRLNILAYGLIIGGAIGNLIDRVRFGAVADFLYFHWRDFHYPAFNVADSCIFIGVVILVFGSIFDKPKPTS